MSDETVVEEDAPRAPDPLDLKCEFQSVDADGRLGMYFEGPRRQVAGLPVLDGRTWIEMEKGDAATQYYDHAAGALTARPTSPARLDGAALVDVPAGSVATVDGQQYADAIDDGRLEVTFSTAGEHTVTLTCWPYLDATFAMESA